MKTYKKPIICPSLMAKRWSAWCGDTPWTAALENFAAAGGMVQDWGGVPRTHSSIPLTFALIMPDGSELPDCRYRLADIKRATKIARDMRRAECAT